MSVLTLDMRPVGYTRPLARFEIDHRCVWLSQIEQVATLCRAHTHGSRRTLVPAASFPEIYGGEYAPLGPNDARRFEDVRALARELGVDRHVYLALNATTDNAFDASCGEVELWVAAVHARIGVRDLRRLEAASGGAVRWVSPAGLVVPLNEQIVRSR